MICGKINIVEYVCEYIEVFLEEKVFLVIKFEEEVLKLVCVEKDLEELRIELKILMDRFEKVENINCEI